MTVATRLQVIPVQSAGHVNCMRVIRNSGSAGYSGDDFQITEDEQQDWWRSLAPRMLVKAWLYASHGVVVGYGMYSWREDQQQWSPSAGVLPEHRGRGYGKWIVSHLAQMASAEGITLYAKAWLNNEPAVATHDPKFWERVAQDADYAYFRSRELDP